MARNVVCPSGVTAVVTAFRKKDGNYKADDILHILRLKYTVTTYLLNIFEYNVYTSTFL